MKNVIRTFVGAMAIASLAGCAGLTGALAPAIPGMSAAPTTGASAAPATGTTPTTGTPTTPTAPVASKAPGDIGDTAADCKLTAPAATPEKGSAELGAFANQNLPAGYNAAYSTEAEVYEAIGKLSVDNWACFQKFYPGASGLYKKKMGL